MKLLVEIELGAPAVLTIGDVMTALRDTYHQISNHGPMNVVLMLKDKKVGIACNNHMVGMWHVEDANRKAHFKTYCISDQGEGVVFSGIPSLAVAASIARDHYRRDRDRDEDFPSDEQHVVVTTATDHDRDCAMTKNLVAWLTHENGHAEPFGSISSEHRCACCRQVKRG